MCILSVNKTTKGCVIETAVFNKLMFEKICNTHIRYIELQVNAVIEFPVEYDFLDKIGGNC